MPIISLGFVELRYAANETGTNWTDATLAFVTDRNEAGLSTRETAIRCGFRSDHLLELIGEDDPSSTKVVNGTTYYGRRASGPDGKVYTLTADQVAAKAEYNKAMKESKRLAAEAARFAAGGDPSVEG